MRLERRLRARTAVDMTPLIDVVLTLIVFFMITTSFKSSQGIELALPQSSTSKPVPTEDLKVLVVSRDEIHVGKMVTDLVGLGAALAAEEKRNPQKPDPKAPAGGTRRALLEGSSKIDYQLVVSVLDALRRQGIDAVGLATTPAAAAAGAAKR